MKQSFDQFLVNRTGYKPSQCKCKECKAQCKTPCLGTPDDIIRLIEHGYIDKLAKTGWAVGMLTGHLETPIEMIQPIVTETGCIFFKNGLCELHEAGLKPTEGRFSNHNIPKRKQKVSNMLSWNVAIQWLEPTNFLKILLLFRLLASSNSRP